MSVERVTKTVTVEIGQCSGVKSNGDPCSFTVAKPTVVAHVLGIPYDREARGDVRDDDGNAVKLYCGVH